MKLTWMNRLIYLLFISLFITLSINPNGVASFGYFIIIIFGVIILFSIGLLYKGWKESTNLKRTLSIYTAASIMTVAIAEFIRYFAHVDGGFFKVFPDALWIVHILLLSVGLAIVIKRVRSNFQISYLLLDLHISITVFGSIWFVTYQNFDKNHLLSFEMVYPLGALYVLFIMATLLLINDKPIKRNVLNSLLLGLSICMFSSVLLMIDSLDGVLYRGKYLILDGLGLYTIAAAFVRKQSNIQKRWKRSMTISYSHWEIIRPIIQYTGVLVLLYEYIFYFRDSNILFIGLVITVVLVICRDLITIVQNQSLVRRLKIFNQQLEKKIGERTKELTNSHRDLEHAFEQIEYVSRHDTFSQLPNRRFLEQMIERKIQQNQSIVSLIIIDVNRLKHINDTVGHAVGDLLLLELIKRIQLKIPRNAFLARHGGDEFAIVIDGLKQSYEVEQLTEQLLETVESPFHIQGKELSITISIGVSIYPNHSKSVEDMMKHADLAMYKAKEEQQNKVVFYSPDMNEELVGRMELLNELHNAVKRNEFVVNYQPQFHIGHSQLSGVEALVRWNHPTRGYVSPGEFIPLAEEFDLIVQIDGIVLETAIAQFMEWKKRGIAPPRLSVNLCPQQFEKGDLSSKLKRLFEQYQFPPHRLILEITESVAMKDEKFLTSQLQEVSSMGVQISIDDFGTGYSSLSYVKNYPLNQLKIARPFITDVPRSNKDIAMVKAIIDLSHHFNLNVVVEGVETVEQLNFLKSVQCEEVQGFYYSKPLHSTELEKKYLLQHQQERLNA
ncbi:putative bifunctional diguanylate cyclase/phosphodiesterase [Pseudalkalibacillus berkeleyi]|uniref:EAL domain-containing protein n=1 Tax=Pseudalkalibacillus berkeleyi TaxID=1069813 RepID=A0ABS9GV83_9BACL|nr:EAL domain-containing protein [Pseudalkalibacillus berkeleyi]MCF6136737.1 EAL domain-containing protein [Pseudalkalibacillus berkeleyi]